MYKKLMSAALTCIASGASAEGQWTIGALAIGATEVYVGDGDTASFAPIISYDTEKLHIGFDGLTYQVYDYGLGQIDVAVAYRGAPAFPENNARFKGLKREDAVEIGLSTQLQFGDAYVGLDTLTDVTDAHGGTEADVTLGYEMNAGAFQFDAAIGARYRSAKLNQYLYGVTALEATANRSAFIAGDTTTAFANLTAAYPLTDSMTAVAQIGIEDIGKNFDSPLVSRSTATAVGLGVAWTF